MGACDRSPQVMAQHTQVAQGQVHLKVRKDERHTAQPAFGMPMPSPPKEGAADNWAGLLSVWPPTTTGQGASIQAWAWMLDGLPSAPHSWPFQNPPPGGTVWARLNAQRVVRLHRQANGHLVPAMYKRPALHPAGKVQKSSGVTDTCLGVPLARTKWQGWRSLRLLPRALEMETEANLLAASCAHAMRPWRFHNP